MSDPTHNIQPTAQSGTPSASPKPQRKVSYRWRPVDIAVTAVIGVASGVIFWLVDLVITAPYGLLEGVLPGLAGIFGGLWYFAGVLGILIVRKPGAALFAEVIAAVLELTLGNQWGAGGSVLAGLFQGVLTEIAFLIFAYKVWNVWSASLGGAFAAVGGLIYSFTFYYAGVDVTGGFVAINVITNLLSGALVSGALMWALFVAIAKTGALENFESGRSLANRG